MLFEIGDKVKRVNGSHLQVTEGGVYTVKKVLGDGSLVLEGHTGSYDDDAFVLDYPKVSITVCHEIVALDVELSERISMLEILRDIYKTEEKLQSDKIDQIKNELNRLKSKYKIEG